MVIISEAQCWAILFTVFSSEHAKELPIEVRTVLELLTSEADQAYLNSCVPHAVNGMHLLHACCRCSSVD